MTLLTPSMPGPAPVGMMACPHCASVQAVRTGAATVLACRICGAELERRTARASTESLTFAGRPLRDTARAGQRVSDSRDGVRTPPWLDRLEVARPAGTSCVVVEDFERWSAPVGDITHAALTEDPADRLAAELRGAGSGRSGS